MIRLAPAQKEQQQPIQGRSWAGRASLRANWGVCAQMSGKGSALNGKVSTSLKTTWTVNRSSYGQANSRLVYLGERGRESQEIPVGLHQTSVSSKHQ